MSVKKAVCLCAAEKEVIGQGYHYDNDHNYFLKNCTLTEARILVLFKLNWSPGRLL